MNENQENPPLEAAHLWAKSLMSRKTLLRSYLHNAESRPGGRRLRQSIPNDKLKSRPLGNNVQLCHFATNVKREMHDLRVRLHRDEMKREGKEGATTTNDLLSVEVRRLHGQQGLTKARLLINRL